MKDKFDAAAFDVDGTLYPNYRFYIRLLPFLPLDWPLIASFGLARSAIRKHQKKIYESPSADEKPPKQDFYRIQSEIMARILKKDAETVYNQAQSRIYRRWESIFKKVELYEGVKQTIKKIRENGKKTAVLSDFPLGLKLNNLGLDGLWDAEICSEEEGMLKPAPLSFLELVKRLDSPPERILFVGNSLKYDVGGAKNAGMKAALITSDPFLKSKAKAAGDKKPDFIFSSYRQLEAFVLG
ncbi:MAG: HAD family hydrolase [Spirochaetaceae bacterium]|jgi:putative hydrolase of the HAD superfamily|nr:HAD family hydrolase [Spirochaetaceae bacterium]